MVDRVLPKQKCGFLSSKLISLKGKIAYRRFTWGRVILKRYGGMAKRTIFAKMILACYDSKFVVFESAIFDSILLINFQRSQCESFFKKIGRPR